MEQNDIIKALECCQTQYDRNCYECPYERHKTRSISVITCESILRKDLLSLINSYEQKIKELTEENERLMAQKYYLHSDGRIEMIPTVESVRADTVRQMQERIKALFAEEDEVQGEIDKIAKELIAE